MAELEQKVYHNQGPIRCHGRGIQVCVNLYFAGLANLIPCFYVLKTSCKQGVFLVKIFIQLVNCLDKLGI